MVFNKIIHCSSQCLRVIRLNSNFWEGWSFIFVLFQLDLPKYSLPIIFTFSKLKNAENSYMLSYLWEIEMTNGIMLNITILSGVESSVSIAIMVLALPKRWCFEQKSTIIVEIETFSLELFHWLVVVHISNIILSNKRSPHIRNMKWFLDRFFFTKLALLPSKTHRGWNLFYIRSARRVPTRPEGLVSV